MLAVVTALPGEVTTRVVAAYALGSGAVAAALAIVLIRHAPRQEPAEALLNAVTSLPGH